MADLVSPDEIEQIVGAKRSYIKHLGCAVSTEQKVYVLHSSVCCNTFLDLRDCRFSIALDRGILPAEWNDHQDIPVLLGIQAGRLVPVAELTYVVCNRLLDAETNEHCEFDGHLEVDARGYWQCPGCRARRYGTGTGEES